MDTECGQDINLLAILWILNQEAEDELLPILPSADRRRLKHTTRTDGRLLKIPQLVIMSLVQSASGAANFMIHKDPELEPEDMRLLTDRVPAMSEDRR